MASTFSFFGPAMAILLAGLSWLLVLVNRGASWQKARWEGLHLDVTLPPYSAGLLQPSANRLVYLLAVALTGACVVLALWHLVAYQTTDDLTVIGLLLAFLGQATLMFRGPCELRIDSRGVWWRSLGRWREVVSSSRLPSRDGAFRFELRFRGGSCVFITLSHGSDSRADRLEQLMKMNLMKQGAGNVSGTVF